MFLPDGVRRCRSDSLQPDLPPIRVDAAWTEHTAPAVPRLAYNRVQDDAGRLHLLHPARLLINEASDPLEYSVSLTAIRDQFRIQQHSPIHACGGQRSKDLCMRFHAHQFAGLKVEGRGRRWLTRGDGSGFPRKRCTGPEWIELVVQPSHRSA